jgi:hypothetical protein
MNFSNKEINGLFSWQILNFNEVEIKSELFTLITIVK